MLGQAVGWEERPAWTVSPSDDWTAGRRSCIICQFPQSTTRDVDELLARVGARISKPDTSYRKALEPGMKLAVTLRHLTSGDTYPSVKFDFRVPHNTMSLLVRDVCQAIVDEYAREVITCPTTPEGWCVIAEEFPRRWNFPHACGSLDWKHIACKCPKNSGSMYYNTWGFYSIVLMGLVDTDYRFLWVDVGADGSPSDAQIFNHSELKEALEDGSI